MYLLYVLHCHNLKKRNMQHQMPVLPQRLCLNLLKDRAKVDEVDYLADFDNFIFENG